MINRPKFRAGDKVRCVIPRKDFAWDLTPNGIYTILADQIDLGKGLVYLVETGYRRSYTADRFELIDIKAPDISVTLKQRRGRVSLFSN